MEGDEIEMSTEELQMWIREKVKKNNLMSSGVQEKCNLLQSLLDRREKQSDHLQRLYQSVSACEAIVKKQYSLLGWKYRDTDSDDDDNTKGCGNAVPSPPATNGLTSLLPKLHGEKGKNSSISLKREPVVVLTRLSTHEIQSICPRTPENHDSEEESSNYSDCDMQWEPDDDSSDSDFSYSSKETVPNKRRKIDQKNIKRAKSRATPKAETNTRAKSNVTKTSTPHASTNSNANSNVKSSVTKTSTPQATTNGPVNITTALSQTSDEATKTPPRVPLGELKVDMCILARRRAMSWQQGKILAKVTKEDGKLKYKIHFKDKGKSLVSGHHIAFDYMPKVDQLFVGARVVIKFPAEDKCRYSPGILGELPGRRNRMRFLVFIDDHKPVYVSLPLLRLVSRPLQDPWDDIPDGFHKNFIQGYMKVWPYPPKTQYRVGQTVNVELNGVMQKCEVHMVDCSLIQVVVSTDQHKLMIYRGSTCLEHMINTRGSLELKKDQDQKKKSPS
ncbi:histone-lysine N-methyltransferase SETDB1-A-like [Anarrhichthys ocellatus]|uniref:histone-lysine N-methyltransferase SETDB1-A-like n=1 Tax=Anarrhichthys ocellatus TaxID=433405 RepID=UPI0012EE2349|nr:histone-lysine N-methyltransferase SETDB1-A-like [Anarrhichthys ocellatus]